MASKTSPIVLRRMTSRDVPAYVEIFNSAAEVELGRLTLMQARRIFAKRLNNPLDADLIATCNNLVVGYKGISFLRPKGFRQVALLRGTFVRRDFRGQGVATQLWDATEKMARERGIHLLIGYGPLHNNKPMRKFLKQRKIRFFGILKKRVRKRSRFLDVPISGKKIR